MASGETIALIILELTDLLIRLTEAAAAGGIITPEQRAATEARVQAAINAWHAAGGNDKEN